MASNDDPEEAEFRSPLPKGALIFRRIEGREELGRLPEYHVELKRPNDMKEMSPLKAKDLLGKVAGVDILLKDGTMRQVNGIVTRFQRGGVEGRYDLYYVELRPWLWHLTLGSDCRIFQEKTALEIIQSVFAEYSSATALENKISGSLAKRPFTVQYRESDYNFISRLMEDEGIYYYFKHANKQHTMVLCNSASGHSDVVGGKLFWATKKDTTVASDTIMKRWLRSHSLRSLKYSHTDFAAEVPEKSLLASAERDKLYGEPNDLEVYDYPGGHDDLAMGTNSGTKVPAGERSAKLRVRAFESGHSLAYGLTSYRPLAVGHTFKFELHPDDAGDYLVTSSIFEMVLGGLEADQQGDDTVSYTCRFDAVPKSVAFQPERVAMTPLVNGPQTATVVGPSGDEIHTDKYGRVKVKFHWDRDPKKNEQSSCFVRVSQPWASKQFGMMALPRIGDEVVVEFLEGNPDRPLITGRVYNGTNMPPWELPAQATVSGLKTRSSKGGAAANANELRFDDKKGSEYVWFQAEKDFHRLVKNDSWDTVQNNKTTEVTKNVTQKIGEAMSLEVGKTVTLKVGEDVYAKLLADLTADIGGALGLGVAKALDLKAGQAIKVTAGQGMDLDAGQAIKMSAVSNVHIKGLGIVIDGGTELTLKAGSGIVKLSAAGVEIVGAMVKINCGGGAGPASAAAKAAPPAPQEPAAPAANTDPLA